MKRASIISIIITALAASILFIQEQVLSFIPNFQFTTVLIILYTNIFGLKRTSIIVLIHVLLDSWLMGFNIIYFIAMFMAWNTLPFLVLGVKPNSEIKLAIIGAIHGVIYTFVFALTQVFFFEVDLKAYLLADIPFTMLLVASNYLTIIWVYPQLYRILKPKYEEILHNEWRRG